MMSRANYTIYGRCLKGKLKGHLFNVCFFISGSICTSIINNVRMLKVIPKHMVEMEDVSDICSRSVFI